MNISDIIINNYPKIEYKKNKKIKLKTLNKEIEKKEIIKHKHLDQLYSKEYIKKYFN